MTDSIDIDDLDADGLGGIDWTTQRLIDSNGTKYVVGWDESGWFNIMHVRIVGDHQVTPIGEFPTHSFHRGNIAALFDAIEEGR